MKTYTVESDKNETQVTRLGIGEREFEFSVKKNASFTLILQVLSSISVESRVVVRLVGSGAKATIIGIVIGSGEAKIKLHTMQQHEAPDTTSNLLVKTALRDESKCVIDGGIRVEKNAQKTDAYQRNENLLLSPTAHAESSPSLEILANDVRCTHGATIGPVSEDELWYLATRGISQSVAQTLIVTGFFRKAVDMIEDAPTRIKVWQSIESAL